MLLSLLLCWAQPILAGDTEGGKSGAVESTNYPDFQSVLKGQMHESAELPQVSQPTSYTPYIFAGGVALAICAMLALRIIVPRMGGLMKRRFKASSPAAAAVAQFSEQVLAETQSFDEFAETLRAGPVAASPPPSSSEAYGLTKPEAAPQRNDPIEEFYNVAPERLETLRSLFSEISRSPNQEARQKTLGTACTEVRFLRGMAEPRELRPIRQMAAALEGLLSQLADTPANVTPSTLRTAASAIVLFQSLCVRGVDPDLADKPPARFLVVDDDPISRRAVSMALKKVFQTPYAAENGKAALEFASREAFDVVFLDVEMPGMDGFEVCTKIHETAANEKTPVVFVTSHSDFESRAKSASTGGRDLIAKPFLSFEITVKALTLLLRSRLDQAKAEAALQSQKPVAARAANGSRVVPSLATPRQVSVSLPRQEPVLEAAPQPLASAPILPATENSSPVKKNSLESGQGNVSASGTPSTKEYAGAFAAHAPGHLREIQAQLAAVSQAREPGLRQEMLGELYVGLHTFTEEAERADLNVIWHLASAVEKVVRKLLEKTNAWTPSAVEAVATAVHLLEELCRGGAEPDLSNPPVRVLVVDDEPLARRAISSALQLNFAKPDNAESGEEALALTEKKPFDVIFMDVLMPGIDGFATCSKIRESGLNTTTPVVFVTGHSDAESREKSVRCGGNGFISKPVLPVEISLTALTFTLRSRMEHLKQPQPVAQLEPALCVH